MWNLLAAYPALYISAGFILGLLFGSFLNVVIIRLPRRLMFQWKQQCLEYLHDEDQRTEATNHHDDDSPNTHQAALSENGHTGAEPTLVAAHANTESCNHQTQCGTKANNGDEPPGIVFEPSHCVICKNTISAWENIPVISYLILRGRCRHCGTRISPRYPIVEFITAVLSAVVLWQLGPSWAGLGGLAMTWCLVALTGIDIDHQLLPDNITLPLLWLGLALNVGEVFTTLDSAVIGAIAGYLSLWLVFQGFRLLTGKEGMGFGDFKLTAALGAWLGWQMLPVIILMASVSGTIIGVSMVISGRQQRGQAIPFGPYLAMGGWIAMLWGSQLLDSYLGSF